MAEDKTYKRLFNIKVQFFALNLLPLGKYHTICPACIISRNSAIFRPHQYILIKSHNPKHSKRYGGDTVPPYNILPNYMYKFYAIPFTSNDVEAFPPSTHVEAILFNSYAMGIESLPPSLNILRSEKTINRHKVLAFFKQARPETRKDFHKAVEFLRAMKT